MYLSKEVYETVSAKQRKREQTSDAQELNRGLRERLEHGLKHTSQVFVRTQESPAHGSARRQDERADLKEYRQHDAERDRGQRVHQNDDAVREALEIFHLLLFRAAIELRHEIRDGPRAHLDKESRQLDAEHAGHTKDEEEGKECEHLKLSRFISFAENFDF